VKRIAACLVVVALFALVAAGCKSEGKVKSKEAPPDQKALGADLMKNVPSKK
jgi:hypothetical protein